MIRAPLRREMARVMTEDELLQAITDAATYLGWRWHHVRRSDLALQQGHSGFPDLVLARAGALQFLELKRAGNTPTRDQLEWMEALSGWDEEPLSRVVRLVTPYDLDSVLRALGATIPIGESP